MFTDQQAFDVRCEWGQQGVAILAPISDVVIIVDVLSFSTTVDIAVNHGALVFPYPRSDESATSFAASLHAELADPNRLRGRYSLSPASFAGIPPGTRIVLPSANGAPLTRTAAPKPVLAGCLRNASAVAAAAQQLGARIAVIPAGERWHADDSLRPSFEDLVGAGAIISHLRGRASPEARSAVAAFRAAEADLAAWLCECSSGRELIERGYEEDVRLASQLDVSDCAPALVNGAFVQAQRNAHPGA